MQHLYKTLILLLFVPFVAQAKKTYYPVSDIPASLLENADAVVRENSSEVEIISESKVLYKKKYVITILKESAADKAIFEEGYSKFISISNIAGVVYNEKGEKIESYGLGDIRDITAISGYSLYDDSRIKRIKPKINTYPYTIEYTFEVKQNTVLYLDSWLVFEGFNTAVQKKMLKLSVPDNLKIKFKEYNLAQKGTSEKVEGKTVYTWAEHNYKAPLYEPLSTPFESWAPMVKLSPTTFQLDDYSGSFDSWDGFGKFVRTLNDGRDNIPQETIDKVTGLLNDGMSDKEKIATIYKFCQDKNRYVNIAIGIGGLQPFDAKTVDENSYGDCKALSNYTASILRKFGFTANYTLVYAGRTPSFIDKDFVGFNFNHAMLSVPLPNDTIWLECTNPFCPAGYIGNFTDDRYVLMIKENGGELVKTPAYNIQENNQATSAEVTLSEAGDAVANISVLYKGSLYSDEFGLTLMDDKDKRKSVIKSIHIPNFKLQDFDLKCHKERKPVFEKNLTMDIPGFGSSMGSRYFIKLNLMNSSSSLPPYARNRKNPMWIKRNYSENDTITYHIPEGLTIESLPKEVNLESEFGKYGFLAKVENNSIVYTRYFEIKKGQYPKEKYNEFVEFLEKISKQDEAKAVLIKKS